MSRLDKTAHSIARGAAALAIEAGRGRLAVWRYLYLDEPGAPITPKPLGIRIAGMWGNSAQDRIVRVALVRASIQSFLIQWH